MFKIQIEHNGRKYDNLSFLPDVITKAIAESVKSQIESNIDRNLYGLKNEMNRENGKLTVTIKISGEYADINYHTDGFSNELESKIFKALGV